MGIYVLLITLELNHVKVCYYQAELISLGLGIASGAIGQKSIVEWLEKHQVIE
jgi:death-on-curing protein